MRYQAGQWQYNLNNTTWVNFTPQAGDRLVAHLDFDNDTVTPLVGYSGNNQSYTWDHRNRLTSVIDSDPITGTTLQEVKYTYDAFDQRVGKRVDTDGDGTWDRDEAFIWANGQTVLRVQDADGEGTSESFRVTERYLWGQMVDQLLAEEQYDDATGPVLSSTVADTNEGEPLWALADHLGSVRDWVDDAGVVRQHVVYDEFGNRIAEQDYDATGTPISSTHAAAVDSLFGYTGRDYDTDTNLQNNRARWYDATTGRWLSQDPIGFAAGDANLYRYVGNGATTYTDPDGLDALDNVANFAAGFSDSLTMGVTGYVRQGFGIDDGIRYDSGYYIVGETVETVGEVAVTCGGALGKKAGQKFAREVGEEGLERLRRQGVRRARQRLKKQGKPHSAKDIGQGHHSYPVKEGKFARPQRAADPDNIEFLHGHAKQAGTAHNKAHKKLQCIEKVDNVREATLPLRQAVNEVKRRHEVSKDNKEQIRPMR